MNLERLRKKSIHIGRQSPRQLKCGFTKGPCRRTADHRIWEGECQKCYTLVGFEVPTTRLHGLGGLRARMQNSVKRGV